jgi:chromosome segregation ATPase
MGYPDQQTILMIAGAILAGGLIGWLLGSLGAKRLLGKTESDWRARYDKALQQIEKLKTQSRALETSLETERAAGLKFKQATVHARTELDSLREKANTLAKNVFTLGAERDQLNGKLESNTKLVHAAKLQMRELQTEFQKSKDFYTAQLKSAVEQRQLLEGKINDARHEQESLNNLLEASQAEHQSVSRLLASAQARVEGLEKLENKVVALEANNADLRQQATLATREAEALQHDVAELQELKIQNKELAHCLQSMERCETVPESIRTGREAIRYPAYETRQYRRKLHCDARDRRSSQRRAGEQWHNAALRSCGARRRAGRPHGDCRNRQSLRADAARTRRISLSTNS